MLHDLREIARYALMLGNVKRATLDEKGLPETDTTHTFMLTLCCLQAAANKALDIEDFVVLMGYSLVHDLTEAITGDIDTFGGLTEEEREAKNQAEVEALETIRESLPFLASLIDEYEKRETEGAQIVNILDKIMPKLTHLNNGCLALMKRGTTPDELQVFLSEQFLRLEAQTTHPGAEWALELYLETQNELVGKYKALCPNGEVPLVASREKE